MPSVSEFLLERLTNAKIKSVFGVCGDYILNFYKKLSDCEQIDLVNSTDEAHAGFAANAYARVNGIGAVCVTYNVGALKIANSVACAYAERCPVVVISGSPGIKERAEGIYLHHMVRTFETQKEIFDNITCASTVLDDPNTAGYEIDRVFEALAYHKQPIYIELPRDIADKPITYDVYKQGTPSAPVTDAQNLEEALLEVTEWIKESENPVILAGVQLARYGLGEELLKFAERWNIPIAVTLLSKSVVSEKNKLFLGVYAGSTSKDSVKEIVENSDCLLMFGEILTDMTLGFLPKQFKKRNVVECAIEGLKVKNHTFTNVTFQDFCVNLFKLPCDCKKAGSYSEKKFPPKFEPQNVKLTTARFFEKINSILNSEMVVIADVGDSLFGASDLIMHTEHNFIGSAFYTSMGTAIPGALGVQLGCGKRPIVLVGDGAFQMSCSELSTIVLRKLNPIVFVLNNKGYTTERFLLDGTFNDINNWNYHKIVEMIGGGVGFSVNTETDLESAVESSLKSKELCIVNVNVETRDISLALARLTDGLSKRIR